MEYNKEFNKEKTKHAASENREAAAMKRWRRNQPEGVDPVSGMGRMRRG